MVPDHPATIVRRADTVVIPSFGETGTLYQDGRLDGKIAAVIDTVRPRTRLVSICTAGFVLAATGRLDGRRATTHWLRMAAFRRLFPRIQVEPDALFVDEGDILTSAGVASGIDLCLHILRRDHGAAVAHKVACQCVVPPWREGGQSQYVRRAVPEPQGPSTAATRTWMLEHLSKPLTLERMADHAHMSVRTFTRRFRDEVGLSPNRWLIQQRINRVRQLLEASDLTVDQVAGEAGFGTTASMRQHLHAELGVSPSAYRRTFRALAD
jgi:transcriptional regulator GlxA family with amidase domain